MFCLCVGGLVGCLNDGGEVDLKNTTHTYHTGNSWIYRIFMGFTSIIVSFCFWFIFTKKNFLTISVVFNKIVVILVGYCKFPRFYFYFYPFFQWFFWRMLIEKFVWNRHFFGKNFFSFISFFFLTKIFSLFFFEWMTMVISIIFCSS